MTYRYLMASSLALLAGLFASGAKAQQTPETQRWKTDPRLSEGQIAPILEGLGDHTLPITAKTPRVQNFFDQGLRLTYGFNHAEALRAYREAARLDPDCAMAYWGEALALGPNINTPMNAENGSRAYEAIQKALALKDKVTPKEGAFIEALATRYAEDPEAERRPLDEAYAGAMRQLAGQYPDDPDVLTLFAASVMNVNPWPGHEYWNKDGTPRPGTREFTSTLERVIRQFPEHPGGHHYYIHAVEASTEPGLAEESADRLGKLMPGAGHIVHMPSHIYIRVGRYADATRSNEMAVEADEGYITQCSAQGLYPAGYYPHNIHFLWASAEREGRSRLSIQTARKVAAEVPPERRLQNVNFLLPPLYAMVRFGKWDEIMQEPQPAGDSPPMLKAMWHYSRGMALRGLGRPDEAEEELEQMVEVSESSEIQGNWVQSNPATLVLMVARHVLAGEIAAKRGNLDEAIAQLSSAVRFEDGLTYTEPPDWDFPARQSLGALLLDAGRDFEAEVVYWEDLRRNPENGWSLFGLARALRKQGKDEQAGWVEERFKKAWAKADISLTASRF